MPQNPGEIETFVYTFPNHLLSASLLSLPMLVRLRTLFSSSIRTKIHKFMISSHACYKTHTIFLRLIIL